MARSLHVRLDSEAVAALNLIRSDGLNDSEAVRTALHEAAARRRARSALREEAAALAADPADRAEKKAIRQELMALAPFAPE